MTRIIDDAEYDALVKRVRDLQAKGLLPTELTEEQVANWAFGQTFLSNPSITEDQLNRVMAVYRLRKVLEKCELKDPPFLVEHKVTQTEYSIRLDLVATLSAQAISVTVWLRDDSSEKEMTKRIECAIRALFNKSFQLCWPLPL